MRTLRVTMVSVLGVLVTSAVVIAIVFFAAPRLRDTPTDAAPLPRFATEAPVVAAAVPVAIGVANLADPAWIARTSAATGIPPRALRAYAGVAIAVARGTSGCAIGWNTLAAIGDVESRHGTIFGGHLAADGDATPPIYGIPLAGGSVASVPDSDKGSVDGDATIDRAVGPMQFIPHAWLNWASDGNADGVKNPQNIDDATYAASSYLCRSAGQEMGTEAGWRAAILGYNASTAYLDEVVGSATKYADEAGS